jgi:hypothetical protein
MLMQSDSGRAALVERLARETLRISREEVERRVKADLRRQFWLGERQYPGIISQIMDRRRDLRAGLRPAHSDGLLAEKEAARIAALQRSHDEAAAEIFSAANREK